MCVMFNISYFMEELKARDDVLALRSGHFEQCPVLCSVCGVLSWRNYHGDSTGFRRIGPRFVGVD